MTAAERPASSAADRAFCLLQELLPKHLLSRGMHALARSEQPSIRNTAIRLLLGAYPQIDPAEALEPDPFAYPSFNAFFTRALRAGVRPIAPGPDGLVSPVDGTLSQFGEVAAGRLLQAKGLEYTAATLLGDASTAAAFSDARYACIYLAPYDYHRIHMPAEARLRATWYLPGRLFSVNAATARTVRDLFGRNERVVCEFDTRHGPLALVMVGALFVGSIATVPAGEVNPPARRGGGRYQVLAGRGSDFARGAELGRFNMGSTVVLLWQRAAGDFAPGLPVGTRLRMGQLLAAPASPP